jgi:hypothetical protein
MQKWEYSVFASHLDPAEVVDLLDSSGSQGWELVALVAVTDYHPSEVVKLMDPLPLPEAADSEELIPVNAFRYVFKRPLL